MRLSSRLKGPLLLALIVILFNWKLVLTNQYTWLEQPDISYQILPWMQFQAAEWHQLHFPMWDPHGWFGQPLMGQAQPGAAYPLNWMLFALPFDHGFISMPVLNWYFMFIRLFAALAAYALCRDLGRSRAASILAGCLYGLGGYVANTNWPQMVNGAVWSPLVLLFLLRAERGERPLASSLLSGFFLGAGWLAGHHQMNIFVSLAVLGLWLWLFFRSGRPDWRIGRLAVCSFAMAVLASGLQTLPMAEYGARAVRWVGSANDPVRFDQIVPYSVHAQFSLEPSMLLGIFIPGISNGWNPYVGIAGFSIAVLGLILAWRQRHVRWLAMMALGGLVFALGPSGPLHGILYALVPLVEKARSPSAAIVIFGLALAPLAAFGLDALTRPESSALSRRAGWILSGAGAILATIGFVFLVAERPLFTGNAIFITAICAVLLAGLLAAWRAGAVSIRAGSVAVILLSLWELSNVTNQNLANRTIPEENPYLHRMFEHADLVAYVHSHDASARVDYDGQEIPYNIGDWSGLETSSSYLASITENVWKMDVFSERAKDFFGIRYYFGKEPKRPQQREIFQGASGVKIFENPTAYPRVWAVHNAITIPDKTQIVSTLGDQNFDPRATVFVVGERAPELQTCSPENENVRMPVHDANYLRIEAHLQCRAMVILTDTWYPGWRATVDGHSAKVQEVYGGVRGVVVDSGNHTIEMRYRPWSIFLGGLMTLIAAVVAGLAWFRTG